MKRDLRNNDPVHQDTREFMEYLASVVKFMKDIMDAYLNKMFQLAARQ